MFRKFLLTYAALMFAVCTNVVAQEMKIDEPRMKKQTLDVRDGSKIEAELWRITVPENRQKPESGTISLAVIRIKSPRADKGEPIFFLAGGPGGSSIDAVKGMIGGGGSRFFDLVGGDIIGIDQRGIGLSEPGLSTDAIYGLSPTEPGNPPADLERTLQVIKQQAVAFREKGIDLNGYNTRESADDIDAVRKALGYEKIVLWGSSYGTHLAMATIRRHEEHIARALLVGPEGPDHTQKLPSDSQKVLTHISKLAARSAGTKQQIPDMMSMLQTIFERLDESPVYVDVGGEKIGISKPDLQGLIAMQISSIRDGADQLPAQVKAMFDGDFSEAASELSEFRKTYGPESLMALAMDSSSGASQQRQQQIADEAKTCLLGEQMNARLPAIARALGIEQLDNEFRSTLKTKVPVLFVVGSLDYRTPVSNAKELMKHMPNSNLVVVENCGHADLPFGMPQVRAIWGKFLSTGSGVTKTINEVTIELAKSKTSNATKSDSLLPDGAIELSPTQLAAFEGEYRFERGDVIKIGSGDNHLILEMPGKGDFKLWPKSETEFFAEIRQIPNLEFSKDDSGRFDSFTGDGKTAKRVKK